MSTPVDIGEFATTVERVCDFLLDKVKKDGSSDVLIIQQLKEDAANLQVEYPNANVLDGLESHMRGLKESQ